MLVGVSLNLTAVLGIINILKRQIITQRKEKVMILAEAFRTRDRTIKNRLVQSIIQALPQDRRADARKIVDDAFTRGNNFWIRRHVVDLVGPDGAKQLEDLMQKELQL